MGYVIAAIVVLLLVAGFVTFLVLSSMRKGSGGREGAPGIGGDQTPLGDTTEHAGDQAAEGKTAGDPESAERGFDPAGEDRAQEGGEGPSAPARPEDRQLRDAGAGSR